VQSFLVSSLVNRIFDCKGEVDAVDMSRRRRRWEPTSGSMCGPQINLGAPRIWGGSEVPQAPMEWRWRRRRSLRGRYYFIEPYPVEDGDSTSEEDDDGGGNDDQGG
jgi:hypothetical protein